jgi:RNA polymerase sigma-70 factor (ECF subfamily)
MRQNEESLFESQFRSFADLVYTYALRRADADVAQDVTAETFLVAWRRRQDAPLELLPWLYGIARGVLANERRAANRRDALAARMAANAVGPCIEEERGVLEALGRLREQDREILLLIAWEGLSTRQAATALDCSPTAAAVRLHRARRRLARLLATSAPDDAVTNHSISEVST